MHRLVPQMILNNFSAGKMNGSFPAAGIFVDISGFSAMTDALMAHGHHGAEVLVGVMDATFGPLIRAIFEQGGFVTGLAGDAVAGLFPIVTTPREAAQRALAAAWRIQEEVGSTGVYSTEYGEYQIRVKVGLSSGEASWVILASPNESRLGYVFRGSAVDRCADAEGQASAGEILTDPIFAALVQGAARLEAVGGLYRLLNVIGTLPQPTIPQLAELDMELLGRFFSPEILAERDFGEFRQVVVIFAGFPEIHDPGELEHVSRLFYDLQSIYGGLLDLRFGDKGAHMMAFWGAPVAYENDIDRAVSFLLDLKAQSGIAIRAGITYRVALAGYIGSPLAEEFTVYGRPANLAARFMVGMADSEIWVDENVARRAVQHFNLSYLGEQRFKGFTNPQKVYLLLGRKEESETFYAGTFTGREKELKKLRDFTVPVFGGLYAGFQVVWGEPGVGKSRLVHEFLGRLGDQAPGTFQTFLCQSDAILRQPLNPFRYWLRRYFQISDKQGDLLNKLSFDEKLESLIAATQDIQLANEVDRTRSFLGALVDLHWPKSLYEQVDAKSRYENTLMALTALIKAESRQKPVILFFEDVHQIDDGTRAFLPRLLRSLEGGPDFAVAVIGTARYEGMGLPLEAYPYQELDLGRLDREALAGLAESQLEGPPSAGLVDLLVERSEGNPFFAEQILQYLCEENLLDRQNGEWAVETRRSISLPADVDALLVARLDRLALKVRRIVQTAAVLGREFEVSLLATMLEEAGGLGESLEQAEREGIWAPLTEIQYIFRHAMMRDAAYQMQLVAHRQSLHKLALAAYESTYAGHLADRAGELAYHAESADMIEKARYYLSLAGKKARDDYQNSLAVEYLSRALAFTPNKDLEKRFDLLTDREAILARLGEKIGRFSDLEALTELAAQLKDPRKMSRVLLRRAAYAQDSGNYPQACELGLSTVECSLQTEQYDLAIAAYRLLASAYLKSNDHLRAIEQAQQGLELVREENIRAEESGLVNNLGMIAYEQGRFSDARTYFEESLDISRSKNLLSEQATALNNLGLISGTIGDYVTGKHYYEQSLALFRKIGDRVNEGLILGNLGWIAGMLGDYPTARAYVEQNQRIAHEVGDQYTEVYSLINLSAFSGALGDTVQSQKQAEQAREKARQIGERSAEAWACTYLGHSLLAQDRPAAAMEAYQCALQTRSELDQVNLSMEPRAGLARSALALGDTETARRFASTILAHLDGDGTLDGTDEPLRVYFTVYLVLHITGEPHAPAILDLAYQQLQSRAAIIPDEGLRKSFLAIPTQREIIAAYEREKTR